MNGGWVDVEGPADFADGAAFLDEGEGNGLLIGSKLLQPPERYAATLRSLAALVGSVADEGALELGGMRSSAYRAL